MNRRSFLKSLLAAAVAPCAPVAASASPLTTSGIGASWQAIEIIGRHGAFIAHDQHLDLSF